MGEKAGDVGKVSQGKEHLNEVLGRGKSITVYGVDGGREPVMLEREGGGEPRVWSRQGKGGKSSGRNCPLHQGPH